MSVLCGVHPGMFSTLGDIIEYTGGCSVSTLGWYHEYTGVFSTVGDTMSTDGLPLGGYHEYTGGYHDECGDIMSTPEDVQNTGISIQIHLFSQWPFPTFIMILPRCSHDIPSVYWTPSVYSWYPPLYSWYPPVHWTFPRCTTHPPGVLYRHYAGW